MIEAIDVSEPLQGNPVVVIGGGVVGLVPLKQDPGEHMQLLPQPLHSKGVVHGCPLPVQIPKPITHCPKRQS